MDPLDAVWHVLNFLAPAFGVGLMAPSLARLVWRDDMNGTTWPRLMAWTTGASVLVLVLGLVLTGHDGRMATYAAMIVVAATCLWWFGFRPSKR
jgi:hypothetical protein